MCSAPPGGRTHKNIQRYELLRVGEKMITRLSKKKEKGKKGKEKEKRERKRRKRKRRKEEKRKKKGAIYIQSSYIFVIRA